MPSLSRFSPPAPPPQVTIKRSRAKRAGARIKEQAIEEERVRRRPAGRGSGDRRGRRRARSRCSAQGRASGGIEDESEGEEEDLDAEDGSAVCEEASSGKRAKSLRPSASRLRRQTRCGQARCGGRKTSSCCRAGKIRCTAKAASSSCIEEARRPCAGQARRKSPSPSLPSNLSPKACQGHRQGACKEARPGEGCSRLNRRQSPSKTSERKLTPSPLNRLRKSRPKKALRRSAN